MRREILNNPNIKISDIEKYISLPYENVNFLIPDKYVKGTTACHKFDLKLTDWNWDKINKVNFLGREIPYLPFDLVADLFAIKAEETFGLRNKNISPKKIIYTYVKTVIILKNDENSLVTSMDCSVVTSKECELKILNGLPEKILKKLGIEKCCFMGDKLGIIINPFVFLPVLQKNIQGRKI